MDKIIGLLEKYYPVYLQGLWGTLWISAVTVLLGTVLGVLVAVLRMSRSKVLNGIAGALSLIHILYLTPARPSQSRALDYSQVEARPIPRENISILLDMKALAEEHGARLAFIIAPYEDAGLDAGIYKSLHQFALEQDIPLLDFNQIYDQAGFDLSLIHI